MLDFPLPVILAALLVFHWLADQPLQGAYISNAKRVGPWRLGWLAIHAGIHALGVGLITGSATFAAIELVAHAAIDEAKIRGRTTLVVDQALHVGCKCLYVALMALTGPWP